MRLTIAVANWNRAWFLDRSIYLFSKQTLPQDDWELVIVDDGSTDQSDIIIRKYAEQGIIKNFHYYRRTKIKEKTGNCSLARNIGVTGSCGDYIVFNDPEVMCMPDWAERHCLAHACNLEPKQFDRIDTGLTSIPIGATLSNSPEPTFNRWVHGMCFCTRDFHGGVFNGRVLGNVYDDYDWFDMPKTYKRLLDRVTEIRDKQNLTNRQIRDEFFFHIATMGGMSIPRKLLYKINGWEENFANPALGLNVWAGEDTWMLVCLNRQGAKLVDEGTARTVHIHHHVENEGCKAPAYASKFATDYPEAMTSNVGREWGRIEPDYQKVF
jgi:glycosyltransferase involved in cell wall biosynthesis